MTTGKKQNDETGKKPESAPDKKPEAAGDPLAELIDNFGDEVEPVVPEDDAGSGEQGK